MKSLLGLVLFNSVIHQVEVVIRSRLAAIKKRHEKKLFNLRQQNVNVSDSAVDNTQFNKIIHNSDNTQFFLVQLITRRGLSTLELWPISTCTK